MVVTRNPYSAYRTLNVGTSQMEPIDGETMVLNNAGGYAYELDEWKALERFLILGTESNTYYTTAAKLTKDNAKTVIKLIKADGLRVIQKVLEISKENRAPKVDPSLFVLSLCIAFGDTATKNAVVDVLPKVARIGTHLFSFVEFSLNHRGWGKIMRRAVANWYLQHEKA
jgi:60 kDa SS-A/Ro ribonucleoprotein